MISYILGLCLYAAFGFVLETAGLGLSMWQTWVLIGILVASDLLTTIKITLKGKP